MPMHQQRGSDSLLVILCTGAARVMSHHVGSSSPVYALRAGSGVASPSGRPFSEGRARPAAKLLPRGDVLILGGDLAYPNPSMETYELRFFAPFEAALPPPPVSNSPLFEQYRETCALPHASTHCLDSVNNTLHLKQARIHP